MTATAIQIKQTIQKNGQHIKKISWEDFQKRYLEREDKYKYEWVNGHVEKTLRTMNQYQQFICDNLIDFFTELRLAGKVQGRLSPEVDTFFLSDVHRRPDLAYFSDAQRRLMANGQNQVPQFVIEIISNTDQLNKMIAKMQDYRMAEVPVIWHIFQNYNEIHVYQGKKMTICVGDDMCSAEPVLPNFKLSVNAVLKKN
jgi:Uma2 family endonuclease